MSPCVDSTNFVLGSVCYTTVAFLFPIGLRGLYIRESPPSEEVTRATDAPGDSGSGFHKPVFLTEYVDRFADDARPLGRGPPAASRSADHHGRRATCADCPLPAP